MTLFCPQTPFWQSRWAGEAPLSRPEIQPSDYNLIIYFGSLLVRKPGLWITSREVEKCMTTHRPSTSSTKSAITSFHVWMSVPVDLAFVFDATGSMAATIQAVYAKIGAIARMLRDAYPTGYSFQFGAVGYRDKLDDGSPSVSCPFNEDPEVM
jgi:hypothetical protein